MVHKGSVKSAQDRQSDEVVCSTDCTETEKNIMRFTAKYLEEFKARSDISYNEFRDRLIEIIAMATGEYVRLSR